MEFEWDDNNIEHLARHGISVDEAEDVLHGRTIGAQAVRMRRIGFGCLAEPPEVDISPLSIKQKVRE